MPPKKRRAPSVSMPPQEIARRATLETHVSNSAVARLLQTRAKGKGVGKGVQLKAGTSQARSVGEATSSTEHTIWDGWQAADGGH